MRVVLSLVAVVMLVATCGRVADSRINPFNWFGGNEEERVAATPAEETVLRDDELVPEVLNVEVSPHPGGVIVKATGRAATEGYYDAELVPVGLDGAVLNYEFRAKAPPTQQAQGTALTRELVTGVFISAQTLRPARQIRVIAAQNRRAVRRR